MYKMMPPIFGEDMWRNTLQRSCEETKRMPATKRTCCKISGILARKRVGIVTYCNQKCGNLDLSKQQHGDAKQQTWGLKPTKHANVRDSKEHRFCHPKMFRPIYPPESGCELWRFSSAIFGYQKKKTSKLNMEPAKFHDVLKATLLLDIAPVRFHGKFFGESAWVNPENHAMNQMIFLPLTAKHFYPL